MKLCNICKSPKSHTLMNSRLICFRCDELLFDLEIESDDAELTVIEKQRPQEIKEPVRKTLK